MCFRPMRYGQTSAHRRQQGGYVLVIMLVIIVTGSLYGLLDQLNANAAETSRITVTNNALKQAREALLAYAVTYKERSRDAYGNSDPNGYLPCPDLESDDQNPHWIGTAAGTCGSTGAFSVGLLPTQSLGLPELRDGDGNCLWYAVSGTHKMNPKAAAVPGTSAAQFEVFDAAGNLLISRTGIELGAAAVVLAPGAALGSQNRSAIAGKPCATHSSQVAAYLESLGPAFVTGIQKDAAGAAVKNDQLSWVTTREISQLIGKRSDMQSPTPCDDDGDDCDDD